MKKSKLKYLTFLICILFLFQNCRVYNSKSVTIEDAAQYPGRVKIKTNSNDTYKLENIKKEEGTYYGVVKKNSKAANDLLEHIINENSSNKYVQILLTEDLTKDIHLQSKGKSTGLSVIGIALLSLLVGSLAIVAILGGFFG